MGNEQDRDVDSPATLVAIIVAARRTGDRELERAARREMEKRFGVKLRFAQEFLGNDHGGAI